MKRSARTILIVAGGGLVVFLCVLVFLASVRMTRPVVIAKQALPAGARLTAEYVEVKEIPAQAILPNAATALEEVEGQVLTVARAPGDQITKDMLGDQAVVGLEHQIRPGHRAVAVHVNQASGLIGIIRPGNRVSVVAVVSQDDLGMGGFSPSQTAVQPITPTEVITEVIQPPSTAAYVVVSGLNVLLVPYTFRYQEVLPSEEQGIFSSAFTTVGATQESVVLLEVPVAPVEIAPGILMSPVALLPLLDARADLYLLLEPAQSDGVQVTVGAELGDLFRAITAYRSAPSVLTP